MLFGSFLALAPAVIPAAPAADAPELRDIARSLVHHMSSSWSLSPCRRTPGVARTWEREHVADASSPARVLCSLHVLCACSRNPRKPPPCLDITTTAARATTTAAAAATTITTTTMSTATWSLLRTTTITTTRRRRTTTARTTIRDTTITTTPRPLDAASSSSPNGDVIAVPAVLYRAPLMCSPGVHATERRASGPPACSFPSKLFPDQL